MIVSLADVCSYLCILADHGAPASFPAAPPFPAGADLTGISCPGAAVCLVIGTGRKSWLASTWNGSKWKKLIIRAAGWLL